MPATRSARVRAHAKINLSLKVLHKRPDGFHELRTVFQTIGLADTLELHVTPSRVTTLLLDEADPIPDNLVLRAARRVLEETGKSAFIRMRLIKRIPMGGGLGGGSSDAAAVLLALPVLLGARLSLTDLMRMGRELGSDVPFFLAGGTALGIGRGEEIYPLPDRPAAPLLVLATGIHSATPAAYGALARSLTSSVELPKLNSFQSFVWQASSVPAEENDFEQVVFAQHPQLGRLRGKLERLGAQPARMSGSGSALFGVFATRALREQARTKFQADSVTVFSTETATRARYRAAWWRNLREHCDGLTWPPRSRYFK